MIQTMYAPRVLMLKCMLLWCAQLYVWWSALLWLYACFCAKHDHGFFFFMQGLCVVWGAIKSSCLMSILSKLHSLCCLPEYSSLWTSAKLPAITNFQDHNLTLDASPQDLELDAAEMFFYPVHLELNSLACPSTAANHLILNFLGLEVYRA